MRYYFKMILRPDPDAENQAEGDEREARINVTASSELEARREALNRAYYNCMLVSRIEVLRTKEVK